MVNDLNARALLGDDCGTAEAALERIRRHTESHFESEEALMARSGYPRAREHAAIHQAFSDSIAGLLEAQRAGTGPSVGDVAKFLNIWFDTHLRDEDQRLIEHVRGVKPD
jgi:hemerythrin-like metal-binding protein